MSPRSNARAAMATPAALLFVVISLAQLIAKIRDGSVMVRGSNVHSSEDDEQNIIDGDEDTISVESGHHRYRRPPNSQHMLSMVGDFDFYVYSMSYQPEFCRENYEKFVGCKTPEEGWKGQLTIHGLWPNRNDGTWPDTCSNEQLDDNILQDLSDAMDDNWPNVKSPIGSSTYDSFWGHEWSKHGTCSGLSMHDYFATALKLLVPTPAIVKDNYGSVVKHTAINEQYTGNDTPVLICKRGYLSEVRICYEKREGGEAGERITCPDTILKEDSCGDEIKIASFDNTEGIAAIA